MKRSIELDTARVVAMLGVVLIHTSSLFITAESSITLGGMNLAFYLNQATRFAVPLFVLISGAALGFSRQESYARFLRRRCVRLIPAYLVWSLIYYVYGLLTTKSAFSVFEFAGILLRGGASSHLYFIVLILQFYLLAPLLRRWVQRMPAAALVTSLLITCYMQLGLQYIGQGIRILPLFLRMYGWFLFPTWIFWFVLGIFLTPERLAAIGEMTGKYWGTLAAAGFLFSVGYAFDSKVSGLLDSMKLELLIYVPVILVVSFALAKPLSKRSLGGQAVSWLAARSLTVYYSHVMVLQLVRRIPVMNRGTKGMLLTSAVTLVGSIVFAAALDGCMKIGRKWYHERRSGHR